MVAHLLTHSLRHSALSCWALFARLLWYSLLAHGVKQNIGVVQVMWAEPMTPRLPAKYSNLLASDSGPPTMADSNFSEGSILQQTAETGIIPLEPGMVVNTFTCTGHSASHCQW